MGSLEGPKPEFSAGDKAWDQWRNAWQGVVRLFSIYRNLQKQRIRGVSPLLPTGKYGRSGFFDSVPGGGQGSPQSCFPYSYVPGIAPAGKGTKLFLEKCT